MLKGLGVFYDALTGLNSIFNIAVGKAHSLDIKHFQCKISYIKLVEHLNFYLKMEILKNLLMEKYPELISLSWKDFQHENRTKSCWA